MSRKPSLHSRFSDPSPSVASDDRSGSSLPPRSGPGSDRSAVSVSDHAVLRFLERHQGVDVEAIRSVIAGCCARGAAAGAPVVRLGDVRFLLRGHVVVTCYGGTEAISYEGLKSLIDQSREIG